MKALLLLFGANLAIWAGMYLYLRNTRRNAAKRRAEWRRKAHEEMEQELPFWDEDQ